MWCVPLSRSERQQSTQTAEFLMAEASFSLKGKTFLHPYLGTYFSISFPQAKRNPFQNKKDLIKALKKVNIFI